MIVVNFAHPLTAGQRAQIEALSGQRVERVIDVPTHFDETQSFAPQVAALVERADLTAEEWQTAPLLVNLPAYGPIVAVLLAYLHGLSGHFPTVLRLRPAAGAGPPRFEVAEIEELQKVRTNGREQRRF
jgi:hypothetical protein